MLPFWRLVMGRKTVEENLKRALQDFHEEHGWKVLEIKIEGDSVLATVQPPTPVKYLKIDLSIDAGS
jgi:REP element-mobilizing transposase RayT